MEFDREAKNLIAIMAFVAAIAFGMNAVVMDEPDRSFISWSVGLFVVAVLFWIWIRRDDVAGKRDDALQAAEDAAKRAEELAKRAQDQAEAQLKAGKDDVVTAESVHDYTEEANEAIEEAEEEETVEPEPEVVVVIEEPEMPVPDTPISGEIVVDDGEDDLSRIEGIGPVYQAVLQEADITTFAGIAAKTTAELEAILSDAGKRRPASIDTWVEQAGYAARGDWAGLAKLQSELDGGRRT